MSRASDVNVNALQKRYPLLCHIATPCAALHSVQVDVALRQYTLLVDYRLAGSVAELRMPVAVPPARRDGLWRHSCCELFVRRAGDDGYREFNFAPSGEWAAYTFTGYRAGMTPLAMTEPPTITVQASASHWQMQVRCPIGSAGDPFASARMRFGCSVVVEDTTGALSYWALRHPSGQPDFHHADGFVGEME